MVLIPQCDDCNTVYKDGFSSKFKTVISSGRKLDKKDFSVEVSIRPAHLCNKCFLKILREVIKLVKS